jgi:hypothetical protein
MNELPHHDGEADVEYQRRGRSGDLSPIARPFDELADARDQHLADEETHMIAGIALDGDAPGRVTEGSPQKPRRVLQERQQVGPQIGTGLDGFRSSGPFPGQEGMSKLDASIPPPVDHRLGGAGALGDAVDREAGPPSLGQLGPSGVEDRLFEHPTATTRLPLPRYYVPHGADCRTTAPQSAAS